MEANDHDIIIAPEYNFLPATGPVDEEEKDGIVARLLEHSNGKDTLLFPGTIVWKGENGVMKNAMPVIHDGKVLLEYVKMRDGGEDTLAKRHGLTPSYGNDFGLEICADHGYGMLSTADVNNVDFQVVVSCLLGQWLASGKFRRFKRTWLCNDMRWALQRCKNIQC